jgi:hypothetical protein
MQDNVKCLMGKSPSITWNQECSPRTKPHEVYTQESRLKQHTTRQLLAVSSNEAVILLQDLNEHFS